MKPLRQLIAITLATAFLASAAVAETYLVMVEQDGCSYCILWHDQIAPAYPKTAEGQHAPLVRVDIREDAPDGMAYARKVTFTPTFVLMQSGEEVARMEGYVGEDFFWPLLAQMLVKNAGFRPVTPIN